MATHLFMPSLRAIFPEGPESDHRPTIPWFGIVGRRPYIRDYLIQTGHFPFRPADKAGAVRAEYTRHFTGLPSGSVLAY